MKNVKALVLSSVLVALLAGCSTIEFSNTSAMSSNTEAYGYWHHNVAFSLYELSEPVNLDNCQSGDWSSLTVEKDIITAVAGVADIFLFVDVWDPWAVELGC